MVPRPYLYIGLILAAVIIGWFVCFGWWFGLVTRAADARPGGYNLFPTPLWMVVGTYPAYRSEWVMKMHAWQSECIYQHGAAAFRICVHVIHDRR